MNSSKTHVHSHLQKTNIQSTVNFYCNRGTCRKGFADSYKLEMHHRIHDNNLIKCYFCPWAGAEHPVFVAHMNHHFHVRPFKCPYCTESFYRAGTRKDHEESFHEKNLDKYKCVSCDYSTYSAHTLNYHKHKMHPVK